MLNYKDFIFFKINGKYLLIIEKQVGEAGFEPAIAWTQTKYHTKLDHSPIDINNPLNKYKDYFFIDI